MLTDVPVIDQLTMKQLFRFSIRSGQNVLVLGPSGGGKTHIALQVAEQENCQLIYVNLSVLERTDFQGLPVISMDKTLVTYATPEFLPFADTKTRDELLTLSALQDWVSKNSKKNADVALKGIDERRNEIMNENTLRSLKTHLHFVQALEKNKKIPGSFSQSIIDAVLPDADDRPIVFLFDEVDKAAHEVLQTLLEFLQFHSVNGRRLKIQTCILTGNLPDEFANSAQISHAITKRGMTFKLQLDFNQWREWAFDNNIHPHIIGFLTAHPEYLHKGPPDGDPTAYALPSPRTWSAASIGLRVLDDDAVFSKLNHSVMSEFRLKIAAGNVGDSAAIAFNNWIKYYREMDPIVHDLLENGKFPDVNKLDSQQVFICALSSCSQVYTDLKSNVDEAVIKKHTKNVFAWIGTLQADIQMGSARMAFGGDFDIIKKFNLAQIPEFTKVFKELKKLTSSI